MAYQNGITSSSLTTWPDQPAAPAPDNVDLLPFSQCEISGNRHYQQASKTIPLSVHSSSASSDTCFFPSADVSVAEPPPPLTLPSFPLFKQPALRRLPVPVDAHTSTVIASPQRVHGKKRGVGSSAAAACFVSSPPCPGICAACGRACPGSMTEFGVKRQRRRRQTGHRLLRGYSFPKLPSLTSACPSESPNSLPGLKQQEIAVPRPCLLAQPSCSQNVQTSDYSSHSQQTGDEEVRCSCPNDPVIPSNSLSDLDSVRQVESQGCNGDGEDDGEEEDDYEEDGIRDGDEEEEDDDDDGDDDDDEEEEEEENVAEGDDEDEDYDGEVAPAPCQRFAQNVAVGCTISEPSQVQASVTVSSSVQTSVPKSEDLTLAVAPPPSTATVSRCQVIPRSLDTPVPCSESAIRSGGGSSGFRRARPFKPDMNRAAVANWLRSSGFGNLRSKFGRFSGADMLRLNRRDFIQICGTQEGIRLSNAILQKPPRATCTVYVRRNNDSVFNALYLYHQTEDELRSRLSTFLRPSAPLGPLVLQNSEDIPVIITDEVVSHFEDQGCFTITLEQTTEKEGAKAVLRKH